MKIMNNMFMNISLLFLLLLCCKGQGDTQKALMTVKEVKQLKQNNGQQLSDTIRGFWTIENFDPGYISAFSNDDAKGLLGKQVVLSDSQFRFADHVLTKVSYEIKHVNTEKYFSLAKVDPAKLGIRDSTVVLIAVQSMEDGINHSFYRLILSRNKFIAVKEGCYFFLKR